MWRVELENVAPVRSKIEIFINSLCCGASFIVELCSDYRFYNFLSRLDLIYTYLFKNPLRFLKLVKIDVAMIKF